MIKIEIEVHTTDKAFYDELQAGITEALYAAKKEVGDNPTTLFKSSFNPNKEYIPSEKRPGWFHRVIRKASK